VKKQVEVVRTSENYKELEYVEEALLIVETCFQTLKWV